MTRLFHPALLDSTGCSYLQSVRVDVWEPSAQRLLLPPHFTRRLSNTPDELDVRGVVKVKHAAMSKHTSYWLILGNFRKFSRQSEMKSW